MKKRTSSQLNDWENYGDNFCDLISRTCSSHTKSKKKSFKASKFLDRTGDKSNELLFLSQEGNINWSSSDEELALFNETQSSPVIHGYLSNQFINVGGSLVKSTPSGSPILSQCTSSAHKNVRSRNPSLVPISPITPGLRNQASFANASCFSLHMHDESKFEESSLNHTPLAVPLPESDEEETLVEDFDPTQRVSANGIVEDIEIFTTQSGSLINTQEATDEECPHISTLEESIESQSSPPTSDALLTKNTKDDALKVKGSTWLASVIEKLDEDSIKSSTCNPHCLTTLNVYDSAKKMKIIKNGFAEQLQRVIRQEQTQKVLFKHRLREFNSKGNEGLKHSIKMKVISQHREGSLHVLECKMMDELSERFAVNDLLNVILGHDLINLSAYSVKYSKIVEVVRKGNRRNALNDFYTLIMRHDDVVENDLDLLSVFTIFPPWRELHLDQHKFPVLLCVYHISVNTGGAKSNSASQSNPATQDSNNEERNSSISKFDGGWFQDCESLLEALEKQECGKGICLAATLQRIFHATINDCERWYFLCEDAFGVFFELSLDACTSRESTWDQLIKHGEGQRVYFQHLMLDTRIVRQKAPALFSLIDSVWDPEGFGLLQVQNSQSQNTEVGLDSSLHLQAPSFCYKLLATRWQGKSFPFRNEESNDHTGSTSSDLNRPKDDGSVLVDVLYRVSKRMNVSDLLECSSQNISRLSLLGKVVHNHVTTDVIPLDHSFNTIPTCDAQGCHKIFVIDETSSHSHQILTIFISPSCDMIQLFPGCLVLMKDVRLLEGSELLIDIYTQVSILGKSPELNDSNNDMFADCALSSHLFPDVNESVLRQCQNTRLPDLPSLLIDHVPNTFARLKGIIGGLSSSVPCNDSQCQFSPFRRSVLRKMKSSGNDKSMKLNYSDKLELIVDVDLQFKVKLKILQNTAWNLVSRIETFVDINSSSLNGKSIGPLSCFVYAKSQTSLQTIFCAEEIDVKV